MRHPRIVNQPVMNKIEDSVASNRSGRKPKAALEAEYR